MEKAAGGAAAGEYGSGGMDPTENVKALNAAQALFQKEKDDLVSRYNENEAKWQVKYFEAITVAEHNLAKAERGRIDELASQKRAFDKQFSETQASQVKTTSDLVSAQLEKVASSLAQTIDKTAQNIGGMLQELGKRLVPLEEFRYTMGGKTSVSDPAMSQIANELSQLKLSVSKTTGGAENEIVRALESYQRHTLQNSGISNWIAALAAIIALAALLYVALSRPPESPPHTNGVVHRINSQQENVQ